jgi:hypothetical protein
VSQGYIPPSSHYYDLVRVPNEPDDDPGVERFELRWRFDAIFRIAAPVNMYLPTPPASTRRRIIVSPVRFVSLSPAAKVLVTDNSESHLALYSLSLFSAASSAANVFIPHLRVARIDRARLHWRRIQFPDRGMARNAIPIVPLLPSVSHHLGLVSVIACYASHHRQRARSGDIVLLTPSHWSQQAFIKHDIQTSVVLPHGVDTSVMRPGDPFAIRFIVFNIFVNTFPVLIFSAISSIMLACCVRCRVCLFAV